MAAPGSERRLELLAVSLAIVFCSLVAAFSARPGWSYLLFPELAALSTTVLRDPWGAWGRQPLAIILLPGLAAVAGLWISLQVSNQAINLSLGVLLAVLAAKVLLLLFRSPLVPAVSAAALPVILGIHSWAYPLQICAGLVAFSALTVLYRRRFTPAPPPSPLSSVSPHWRGIGRWLAYLVLLLSAEHLSGLHTLLLPPLIVISHEGLVSPSASPWRGRGWVLPLAFGFAALVGVLTTRWFGAMPALATGVAMTACLPLLRRLRLHLPPVYAMAVLPQLLPHPGGRIVVGVLLGASALALMQHLLPAGDSA